MDPFNIIVNSNQGKIDLNIHPQEAGAYKVFHNGFLLGEIYMGSKGENWEVSTADDLKRDNIPMGKYEASDHQNILLDTSIVQQIGTQISR